MMNCWCWHHSNLCERWHKLGFVEVERFRGDFDWINANQLIRVPWVCAERRSGGMTPFFEEHQPLEAELVPIPMDAFHSTQSWQRCCGPPWARLRDVVWWPTTLPAPFSIGFLCTISMRLWRWFQAGPQPIFSELSFEVLDFRQSRRGNLDRSDCRGAACFRLAHGPSAGQRTHLERALGLFSGSLRWGQSNWYRYVQ